MKKMIAGITGKKPNPTFIELDDLVILVHQTTHVSLEKILSILYSVAGLLLEKDIAIIVNEEEDDND